MNSQPANSRFSVHLNKKPKNQDKRNLISEEPGEPNSASNSAASNFYGSIKKRLSGIIFF